MFFKECLGWTGWDSSYLNLIPEPKQSNPANIIGGICPKSILAKGVLAPKIAAVIKALKN
jgi:hypothetical protein